MRYHLINGCLFITPAFVFAFPGGYWFGPLLLSALGIFAVARGEIRFGEFFGLIRHVPMLWGFAIYLVLYVFLTIYHRESFKDFGNLTPFLLAPFILIAIWRNKPNLAYFWFGCASGALLAFGIGATQVYLLNIERAFGFRHAISFGDTAVILGTGALVGLLYCKSALQYAYQKIYLLIGGVSGLLASLLSGSKGGWLSLFMVIVIVANAATHRLKWTKRLIVILSALVGIAAFVSLMPRLPVVDRVVSAYQGTRVWLETGEVTEGSASIRLAAFKAGIIAGAQSPLLGLGRQGQLDVIKAGVAAGTIDPVMIEKKVVLDTEVFSVFSIDNDLISIFPRQGLLGVLAVLCVHLGIFLTFYRYRKDTNEVLSAVTRMGMLLVLLYIEFGLSISVFGVTIFRTMYIAWAILLLGFLLIEKQRQADSSLPNTSGHSNFLN